MSKNSLIPQLPLIYAHRGASASETEHTKAAYLAAINQGADGFECDVRLTKDHKIICYHDSSTKRLHGFDLKISATSFEELNAKISVLTLADLIDLAIMHKKNLAIETKHPNRFGSLIEKKVNQLLMQRSGDIKRSGIEINLMSFSWLATARNKKTQFSSVYLVQDLKQLRFLTSGTVGISINLVRQKPELISKLTNNGKRIFVWTVNEISDIELCRDLNVSVIITDNPARARAALG